MREDSMINGLNHIAIAVPDLAKAAARYKALGADVSDPQELPEHGVTVVFIMLSNTKIELLYPLGENSPIAGFLEKNPAGGIHHLCFEVDHIDDAAHRLIGNGVSVLGDGTPKIGAHGKPVLFTHPKDFDGALVEFEQA
jgi:methylmalonyl-CoA/ethylmalonyl-CoA epimerase